MSKMPKKLTRCRICHGRELTQVLDLGVQALTGVFPKSPNESITIGPLILVKCTAEGGCGLVQLAHSYDISEMYGDNYGYRSGLNPSMVAHLEAKVRFIEALRLIEEDSIVVDVGSNDGTTLGLYRDRARLVGVDPTANKFRMYYNDDITVIADFFSAKRFQESFQNEKARVVTSLSMFYDMEDPTDFMRQVGEILDRKRGVWVCEQSYMPLMLQTNSYDTACHEHLEYYGLSQILWMAERTGMEIVDVELNDVNGGSFSFVAQHEGGALPRSPNVNELWEREKALQLDDLDVYRSFERRVLDLRRQLIEFLDDTKRQGKRVAALGASTKGNVLLQFCGLSPDVIEAIGEVNPDKFGSFAPGTNIPIVDETELLATNPDYLIVLPWHFREYFERQQRYSGFKLVYPLPDLEVR